MSFVTQEGRVGSPRARLVQIVLQVLSFFVAVDSSRRGRDDVATGLFSRG